MRTSSRQSLTWSAHNAVEECRNSNVKGDAAETGLPNGNGQIRPPEAQYPGEATLAGRCGELVSGRNASSGIEAHPFGVRRVASTFLSEAPRLSGGTQRLRI